MMKNEDIVVKPNDSSVQAERERQKELIRRASEYYMKKNEELYRRLANR